MHKVTRSTGNVFADMGFDAGEAGRLRIRSLMMALVRQVIDQRGLTQAKVAELFGAHQSRVSDLVRGKIDLLTIDNLVDMLIKAGVQLDLRATVKTQGGRTRALTLGA